VRRREHGVVKAEEHSADLVVIGAGVAGLVAALDVLDARPDLRVVGRGGGGGGAARGPPPRARTDAVIIPEPLNVDRICIGHRGAYWFEVTTHGQIAHVKRSYGGRSVAFKITLEDGTQGYFKPEQTVQSAQWHAEIVAYYLDRALGLGRVAPVVTRTPRSGANHPCSIPARMSMEKTMWSNTHSNPRPSVRDGVAVHPTRNGAASVGRNEPKRLVTSAETFCRVRSVSFRSLTSGTSPKWASTSK
jgi:hypothetical protein